MKNGVLVTGAAGLMGSRFCEWLLQNTDHDVIAIDDLSGGYTENLDFCRSYIGRFSFHQLDVVDSNFDGIPNIGNVGLVYHFAAYAAEGLSPFIRKYNYRNNLIATANVINMSIKHGVDRLVAFSSMAVYGRGTPPFSEDLTPSPIDPYGVAKYACEMDVTIAGEQHGLDWCIIRPHNVYGRHQNIWDSYRNVIGIWMYNSLHDLPITIYGDGEQTRAFSHIDSVLKPMYIAGVDTVASKEIINLGGITETSINEVAGIVSEITGNKNIIHLPKRHEVKYAWSTHKKSVDLLGFQDEVELYDGIKDMWEWAKEQPDRTRQIWDEYELDVDLYPYWKPENLKSGKYTDTIE